jgi:hypothetical protein
VCVVCMRVYAVARNCESALEQDMGAGTPAPLKTKLKTRQGTTFLPR